MINKIIDASLNNRFAILLLALLVVAIGIHSMTVLPVDAVPDLTNVQVQILTSSPALGPVEMEQFVTFPVETAMSGIPRVEEIRSVTRFGLLGSAAGRRTPDGGSRTDSRRAGNAHDGADRHRDG